MDNINRADAVNQLLISLDNAKDTYVLVLLLFRITLLRIKEVSWLADLTFRLEASDATFRNHGYTQAGMF